MILLESEGSDADCHCEADRQPRSHGAETMDGTDMRPQLLAPNSGHYEAASDGGGEHWAAIASLIETCKLNGVDPHAYLNDVITKIVNGHPNSRIDELLPWAYPAASALKEVA